MSWQTALMQFQREEKFAVVVGPRLKPMDDVAKAGGSLGLPDKGKPPIDNCNGQRDGIRARIG